MLTGPGRQPGLRAFLKSSKYSTRSPLIMTMSPIDSVTALPAMTSSRSVAAVQRRPFES